jgi:Flp pilus assembly pilin Flp
MRFALWKIYFGLQSLIQREDGQDLVEYALAIAMIAIVLVASFRSFGAALNGYYQYIVAKFP